MRRGLAGVADGEKTHTSSSTNGRLGSIGTSLVSAGLTSWTELAVVLHLGVFIAAGDDCG